VLKKITAAAKTLTKTLLDVQTGRSTTISSEAYESLSKDMQAKFR
jgi:hypothetical protein